AGLEDLAVLRISVGQPGDALLACRARHNLPLPVDLEAPLVEALAGPGLPARVLGHRADDGHTIVPLAIDQDVGVGIALVDQVLTREPIVALQRLANHLDHVVVGGRRWRVSTLTINFGRSSSHVSVKCTLYPTHSTSRLVLYRASVS